MRGFSHFSTNVLDDKPPPNPLLEKRRGKLNAANNLVLQDKNQDLLLFLGFTGQQWFLILDSFYRPCSLFLDPLSVGSVFALGS